jgi:cobalamin synthase
MWSYFEKVVEFVKNHSEFFGLVGAVLGLITAIVGRKKVIVHINKNLSVPVAAPDVQAEREKQLRWQYSIKRALGLLIVCLIGLIASLVALWFFSTETNRFIKEKGRFPNLNWQRWGKGETLFVLLTLTYAGLAAWAIGTVIQLLVALYYGWRYYRSSSANKDDAAAD